MAWTEDSVGYDEAYVKASESVTLPDSGGASETSVNTTNLSVDVSDSKFIVRLTVTETSAGNGSLEVRLQGSPDDTNWTTVDTTTGLSLDTTGTNSAQEEVDASGWFAPYWRFQVFSDGTDTQDDADVTVLYAARRLFRRS